MPLQIRNDELADILRPDFFARYEPNASWVHGASAYLAHPVVRAFWPMSAVAYTNPQGLDITANGNHLTNNNSCDFGYDSLVPYVAFDGVNQNLTRADGGAGNWADILGTEAYVLSGQQGLTAYVWCYFDDAVGSNEGILAKGDGTVNTSYLILRTAGGPISFRVGTGAALPAVTSTVSPGATTWTFIAARYVPSTTLDLWVSANNTLYQSTQPDGVPAALLDSSFTFALGSYSTNILYMTGRESFVDLCASAHSDSEIEATFEQTRAMFNV
jgi:hypothetical protein